MPRLIECIFSGVAMKPAQGVCMLRKWKRDYQYRWFGIENGWKPLASDGRTGERLKVVK